MEANMKKIISAALILLQLTAACLVNASELKVVKALNYIDVVSGKIISPALILIRDDKIEAINPSNIPPGSQNY